MRLPKLEFSNEEFVRFLLQDTRKAYSTGVEPTSVLVCYAQWKGYTDAYCVLGAAIGNIQFQPIVLMTDDLRLVYEVFCIWESEMIDRLVAVSLILHPERTIEWARTLRCNNVQIDPQIAYEEILCTTINRHLLSGWRPAR